MLVAKGNEDFVMNSLSGVGIQTGSSHQSDNAVKRYLKRLRTSQPFNRVATSSVRAAFKLTGLKSEYVIRHLHRAGDVECQLRNGRTLRLWSKADDWVSNQLFWRGLKGYEPETVPLFFKLAARSRVTIDVGAYVGLFTLLAAHANPESRVFAFEPMPEVFERLQNNILLNELPNVQCIANAVSNSAGTAEFFHQSTGMPTSSSLSFEFMRSAEGLISTTVPVTTLDRFVEENRLDSIGLLKIDTESTEPDVLRGAINMIRRDHPIIFCEVLKGRASERELEEILRPIGYRYYLLKPEGPVCRDNIEGHPEWLNYLFTTLSPDEVAALQSEIDE